ncbi:MAG: hypothetical protein AVDCRST_MAG56-691, partial [uncultured Cytophagales bacterium]
VRQPGRGDAQRYGGARRVRSCRRRGAQCQRQRSGCGGFRAVNLLEV